MGAPGVIVLDTNVLVSAVGWRGNERTVYEHCRDEKSKLAISPVLLDELRRVLNYPKLRFDEVEIESFVRDLRFHASLVEPSFRLEVIEADPDDDRVLECAVAAKAAWIVSGDGHLLDLGNYEDIEILNAARAVEILESIEDRIKE